MKRILNFMKPHLIFKMAAPISLMLKYSIVYNFNFPPILIKFVSKFIFCKLLYFKAQNLLRLRSPFNSDVCLGRKTPTQHQLYQTCHKIWTGPLHYLFICSMSGKPCRPWTDAAFCSICVVCSGLSVLIRLANTDYPTSFFGPSVIQLERFSFALAGCGWGDCQDWRCLILFSSLI